MIAFDTVSKSYHLQGQHKTILNPTSLTLPKRNIAIMGRNGAGKSTLMRLIAGTEAPTQGRVIRTTPVSWPLGFSSGFNGSMTGLENIMFVARLYGIDPKATIEYVTWFSELGDNLKLPIKTYSTGMKARLAFGLSMAISFDTYLIDETTAVGDEAFKKKCKAVFDTKLDISSIIMISHSAKTIRQYCDCGYLLENGTLTYHDTIDSLIESYRALLTQETL